MSDVKRSVRVSGRLAQELALLLSREVNDPRLAFVTVTRVTMPDDLRSARVHVRLMKDGDLPERRREALQGLAKARGLLRREAGRRLQLRHAPELSFVYDEGQDDLSRIEALLEEVRREDSGRSRS